MWLYIVVAILTITYVFFKKNLYWKKLGIPGPDALPFVGNLGSNVIGRKHVTEIYADIYLKYKQYPFVGIYRGDTPCILVRDPEIIKNVIIKDFKHFVNNDVFLDKNIDPLVGSNSFVLKDQEWKKSRQQLIPAFSSAKIKNTFPLIENVSKRLVKYVDDQLASPTAGRCQDAKELCAKFTCDNVALCGFGLEGNCFEEPNSEFNRLAKGMIAVDGFQGIKFGLTLVIPKLTNLFSMKLLPKSVEDKLISIVSETLEYRKKEHIERNDFFDFVTKISSGDDRVVEIAAHLANFIVDGYETTASAMAMALLELAQNRECQVKARENINKALNNHNGIFSYDSLQEMTYLDACINEALRKHPPLASLNKTCNEVYKMETPNIEYEALSVVIEPGTPVILPVLGLHMDPKHYPEPERFIPERFMENNHIHKYTFLPFGDGSRSCLGQRFGLIQLKIGLAQLLKNFEVTLNEKTQLPIKHLPFYLLLYPRSGIWIDFHKI